MIQIQKSNIKFNGQLKKRSKTKMIIIHCTASKEGQKITVNDIHRWHLNNNWIGIGYNCVIDYDGTVYEGRPIECSGAHTTNYNSISVGIVYIGGLDKNGKVKDTRTTEQKESMLL